jgi:hypothetical protein
MTSKHIQYLLNEDGTIGNEVVTEFVDEPFERDADGNVVFDPTTGEPTIRPSFPKPLAERELLLKDAATIIMGDRNAQYGDPTQDFARTATMWQTYLDGIDRELEPHDVAVMMILLKVSRLAWSPNKRDHWLDIAGYAGCGFECVTTEYPMTQIIL